MTHGTSLLTGIALTVMVAAAPLEAQWPQFHGPNGSGVAAAHAYPTAFSPSENVIWKTTVPQGQSSPVVAGSRVYVTASEGDRLLTICLDAPSGRELWRRRSAARARRKLTRPMIRPRRRPPPTRTASSCSSPTSASRRIRQTGRTAGRRRSARSGTSTGWRRRRSSPTAWRSSSAISRAARSFWRSTQRRAVNAGK